MNISGLVAILATAIAAPAVGQETVLEPFSFRDVAATTTYEQAKAAGATWDRFCTSAEAGVRACPPTQRWLAQGVAGVETGGGLLQFDSAGLVSMTITVNQAGFRTVAAALSERYGQPCKQDVDTLQNAYGASFDRLRIKWCFSDGQLVADNIYEGDLRKSVVHFQSSREEKPPVVDF